MRKPNKQEDDDTTNNAAGGQNSDTTPQGQARRLKSKDTGQTKKGKSTKKGKMKAKMGDGMMKAKMKKGRMGKKDLVESKKSVLVKQGNGKCFCDDKARGRIVLGRYKNENQCEEARSHTC